MDHLHGHDHDHAHGHDHGHHHHDHAHGHDHGHTHAHDHAHGMSDYFLEQLLSLFICGAFGVVAVLMYEFDRLSLLLVPAFHKLVLFGGVALLVFTVIRGITIWVEAGRLARHHHHDHAHDHGHEHGEACGTGCGHSHDHAHDDHGHSHGGGWVYLQTIVLSFPLLLFLIGVPNRGFSDDYVARRLGQDSALGAVKEVQAKGGDVIGYDFAQLTAAAYDPERRQQVEGRTVRITGEFKPIAEKEFTLFKMKMNCCKADEIPLKARIVTSFVPFAYKPFDWVRVTGTVQFVPEPGKNQYIPVIRVNDEQGIQPTPPET